MGSLPLDGLDTFAAFVRDELGPALRELAGYSSLAIGLDRTTGLLAVMTEWRTAGDRTAANPAFQRVLERAPEFGLEPTEIQLWERPPLRR